MFMAALVVVPVETEKEDSFLQRVHAISKRLDGAMKDQANEIKSRANQTVETPPEYKKKNTNDPPMGRLMADVAKLAGTRDSLLAALESMHSCNTEVGQR